MSNFHTEYEQHPPHTFFHARTVYFHLAVVWKDIQYRELTAPCSVVPMKTIKLPWRKISIIHDLRENALSKLKLL